MAKVSAVEERMKSVQEGLEGVKSGMAGLVNKMEGAEDKIKKQEEEIQKLKPAAAGEDNVQEIYREIHGIDKRRKNLCIHGFSRTKEDRPERQMERR